MDPRHQRERFEKEGAERKVGWEVTALDSCEYFDGGEERCIFDIVLNLYVVERERGGAGGTRGYTFGILIVRTHLSVSPLRLHVLTPVVYGEKRECEWESEERQHVFSLSLFLFFSSHGVYFP